MKKLFLVLCILGVILPYYQLYYFLLENNWSMSGFWADIYSNHAISMITMDITVAATSYLVFIIYKFYNKKIDGRSFIKYMLSLFLVGFSLSMPLYLYDNYKKNDPYKILRFKEVINQIKKLINSSILCNTNLKYFLK